MTFELKNNQRIYVAGHKGMVGSAILRLLEKEGFVNLLVKTRQELNLLRQREVETFFEKNKPEVVILTAAKVGGIQANIGAPADFLYENLVLSANILHACHKTGVKKTVVLGSSCIYPRQCPQPMKEEYLLTGKLEPTNEGYAIAKIAGVKLAQYYTEQYGLPTISPVPCNLYGPNDSFDPLRSHVISALVKKFSDAVKEKKQEVFIWGSGNARREIMHADDAASAFLFLLRHYNSPEIINVGWGKDYSIKDLATFIAGRLGYKGKIRWDTTKPDGMPRKCLDVTKLTHLGFHPSIPLEKGIDTVIADYRRLMDQNG